MNIHVVKAKTIPDAWYQLLFGLVCDNNAPKNIYTIDKGSYVGEKRLEYQYVIVQIDYPGVRPLIPDIPPGLNIPPPVESMDYVEDYFVRYLMSDEIAKNETYTYGSWLRPGIERVISQLKGSAGNNQAAISIGGIASRFVTEGNGEAEYESFIDTDNFIDPATGQRDPACLRVVDFRLDQNNVLHMITYWRCIACDQPMVFRNSDGIHRGIVLDAFESWVSGNKTEVLSLDVNTGKHVFSKISNAEKRYANNIFSIDIKGGGELDVTSEHHVFVFDNENNNITIKRADNLVVGDNLIKAAEFGVCDDHDYYFNVYDALINQNKHRYYLRGLPLVLYKKLSKSGVNIKESWRDKKIMPFRYLKLIVDLCSSNRIGYTPIIGCKSSSNKWQEKVKANDDWGYLIGSWLANGSAKSTQLRIATGQKNVIEKLIGVLDRLGINYSIYNQGKCKIFYLCDVFVRDLLLHFGLKGNAHTKVVPDNVYKFSRSIRESVFTGWFEGDAGCSVSKDLAYGMQCLALSFGVFCSVYKEKPRKVIFSDGREVVSSVCYKLYPTKKIRKIHRLSDKKICYNRIRDIGKIFRSGWVVDFTVEGNGNLFVGNGNILVHNSWDLNGGFPANLAGLQLVKEYVADQIGAKDGKIIASSKGLHVYSYAAQVAGARFGIKNVNSLEDFLNAKNP